MDIHTSLYSGMRFSQADDYANRLFIVSEIQIYSSVLHSDMAGLGLCKVHVQTAFSSAFIRVTLKQVFSTSALLTF